MACRIELNSQSFTWFGLRCSTVNTFLDINSGDEDEVAHRSSRRSASMPAACRQACSAAECRADSKCSASSLSTCTPSTCSPAESDEESAAVAGPVTLGARRAAWQQPSLAGSPAPRNVHWGEETKVQKSFSSESGCSRMPGRRRPGKPPRPSQALRHLYREVAAEKIREAMADPAAFWANPEVSLPPSLGHNPWLVEKLRRRIEHCLKEQDVLCLEP